MKFAMYRVSELGRDLWQAFHDLRNARAVYDDPFFDPDFARMVSEVREDVRIAIAEDGEDLVGVWPMHLRSGGWARPIGGPFSDWHGPVLSASTDLTAQGFLAGLQLSGMTVFGLLPQDGGPGAGFERVGANMTDLSEGWDVFLAEQERLWPKHFKKMRRLYRNVERDFSEYHFNWDDQRESAFERLISLKRDQFARTGFHDVLKPQWAQGLLDRMRNFESPRFRLRLVSVYFDDKHAASELNIQSDKVMHGWLTGFEQDMAQYSPGNMLVQEMLQVMSGEGIHTYDAGPGLDHYKRHYSNYQAPIETGVLRGQGGSLAPIRIAGRAWRWGEARLPNKVGTMMARARRRMDQISIAEPHISGRLSGVVGALSQREL